VAEFKSIFLTREQRVTAVFDILKLVFIESGVHCTASAVRVLNEKYHQIAVFCNYGTLTKAHMTTFLAISSC
jgi:hypothetical protein